MLTSHLLVRAKEKKNRVKLSLPTPLRHTQETEIHPCILYLGTNADKWSASRSGGFIPERRTTLLISQEAGWAPEPVLTIRKREKSLGSEKNRTPNFPSSIPFTIYAIQPSIIRHINTPTLIFFATPEVAISTSGLGHISSTEITITCE